MRARSQPDKITALVNDVRSTYTIGGPNEHGEFWIENSSGKRLITNSREEATKKREQHTAMKILNDLVPRWREHDWHLYAHDAELMVRTIVNEDAEVNRYAKTVIIF